MRNILVSFVVFFTLGSLPYFTAKAQEINARITINTPKLVTVDPQVFKTLENELREFINNRKWTDEVYKPEERISLNLGISISEELGATYFKASANIQASRPVYNSAYQTAIINHVDKDFDFEYAEYQPLEFNENGYALEITHLVAYYVYLTLGLDQNSFSADAGNPFLIKAQALCNNAQQSKNKGWKAFEGNRNRYWIVENLLSSKYKIFNQGWYTYHRMGLDQMYNKANDARNAILEALTNIQNANQQSPNVVALSLFLNAKSNEILSIFNNDQVLPQDKTKAYNALVDLDPANTEKYKTLRTIPKLQQPGSMGGGIINPNSDSRSIQQNVGFPAGPGNQSRPQPANSNMFPRGGG